MNSKHFSAQIFRRGGNKQELFGTSDPGEQDSAALDAWLAELSVVWGTPRTGCALPCPDDRMPVSA
jgi:hypothetical protein